MKKILKLINIFIATITLYACSSEQVVGDDIPTPATKGLMEVKIMTDGALVDDQIHIARFIVFDNVSFFPSVDINQSIPFDIKNVQSFSAFLKVRCNPDKMLVIILNEPETLTGVLESVTSPSDLNTIKFQMAEVFNDNHTATRTRGIPMTGTAHNISITEDHSDTERARSVSVEVERAVARVELWLKRISYFEAQITTATKVTLSRTHNEGYLLAPDAAHGLGYMQTINSPNTEVVWQHTGNPLAIGIEDKGICAFYTPERTSSAGNNADKLQLKIEGLQTAEGVKNAVTTLSIFTNKENQQNEMTEVRRNNVYQIKGNISKEKIDFKNKIVPWTEMKDSVIIDPQYYLTVSADYFYLPNEGDFANLLAETNYDRKDRDFPDGIWVKDPLYYTNTGQPVTDLNSNLYGWLSVSLDGKEGYSRRNIYFTVNSPLDDNRNKGCYATVEVKAGNLTKLIKISR